MRLFRRRPVPASVHAVALQPGERRVAWAVTVDDLPVVATNLGLALPERPRLLWADVEKAVWRRPELVVTEVAEVAGSGRTTSVVLAEDEGGLPDVVRSAVTASVAWSTHVQVQPAGGVRVVGRRRPGQDLLDWQVVYDRGTDVHDPQVQRQAQQVVDRARRAIG